MSNNSITPFNTLTYKDLQRKIAQEGTFNALVDKATSKQIEAPKGRLVRQYDPITGTVVGAMDMAKDAKNGFKAITTGKSNDHALGKINDIGLKLGGLAIAVFLATTKGPKYQKAMEFTGAAAFFTSMALWPKIFIDLPIQLRFGFNPRQKYVDSQGRKKEMYQDNQYIPTDLESEKSLARTADKMGISQDIPDWKELVQKKKRTIALQANTLWMLTAGFATPLMTAFGCHLLTPKIRNHIIDSELRNKRKELDEMMGIVSNKQLGKFEKAVATVTEPVKKFFKGNVVKPVANQTFDIANASGLKGVLKTMGDTKPATEFFSDVAKYLSPINLKDGGIGIAENRAVLEKGVNGIEKALAKDVQALYSKAAISFASTDVLDGIKNVMRNYPDDFAPDAYTSLKQLQADFDLKTLNPKNLLKAFNEVCEIKEPDATSIKSLFVSDADVNKKFVHMLNEEYKGPLKEIKSKTATLTKVVNALGGNKEESVFTRAYQRIGKTFLKGLGLDGKDIKVIKDGDSEAITEVLSRKFAALSAGNKEEDYTKLMGGLKKQFLKVDDVVSEVKKGVGSLTASGKKLDNSFVNLKSYLGEDGGLTNAFTKLVGKGTSNVDSIVSRIITAADFEARVPELPGMINGIKKAEVVEEARKLIYTGTMAGVQNKNYMQDNALLYRAVNSVLFEDNLSEKTKLALGAILSDMEMSQLEKKVKDGIMTREAADKFIDNATIDGKRAVSHVTSYRKDFRNISSAAQARDAVYHSLDNVVPAKSVSESYTRLGEPIVDNIKKVVDQAGNTKAWGKIFVPLGILLVATTLFVQKYFGKVQDEELYTQQGKQKEAQNAGK